MPYCDTCEKYHTPSALDADGRCPSCGETVTDGSEPEAAADVQEPEADRVPWHFKLLIVALVGYLGFRIVQMISWLF